MKTRKIRIICAVLAVLSLMTCFSVPAFAAYENTYVNTGNQRADIVGVALTQVGNTNASHKYRSDNAAWCASFVVWCARQANIDASIIKTTGGAAADCFGVTYKGRPADRSKEIDYTPQPGDLIFFDWSNDGYNKASPASAHGDHVGIVMEVKNGYVYTIEGNSGSNSVVAQKSYLLTSKEIKGYGVPANKNSSSVKTTISNIISQLISRLLKHSVNFKIKSGAYTNAYTTSSASSKVGRVYTNDVVTITGVYDNGMVELSCPWDNGTNKTVFCRVTELKFKATKYINAYAGQSTSNKVGRVYPGDICEILEINYQTGFMKCRCPWDNGTMKTIYIKYSDIY